MQKYISCCRFTNTVDEVIVDSRRYIVHFVDGECDDDYILLRRNAIEEVTTNLPTYYKTISMLCCDFYNF